MCVCAYVCMIHFRDLLYVPATTVSIFRSFVASKFGSRPGGSSPAIVFFVDLSGIMGNPGKTCPPKGHVEKIVIEGLPFVFRLVRVLFEKAWKHLGLNYARGVNLQQLDIDKNINQNSS